MLYKPEKERLWDTWIVPYDGQYYLFYIRVSDGGTRWDGVSLAISDDLLHWQEKGTVIVKHPEAVWLGTGMVQKVDGRFIMNFSEERPAGHQVVCFAQSVDLLHWERLDTELRPDANYYLTDKGATSDFLYRWDSVGIVDALVPHDPPYYGFVTASMPADKPGKTGALGVVKSMDGVHWECLPPGNHTDAFSAYEVPEHVSYEGRHYIIFSTSEYLMGKYSGRSEYLEGGCYYLASGDLLAGYAPPPGDPMLIGTRDNESPCMKTVARMIKVKDDVLVYYQWGDLSGDGWVGVPLLLKETQPWRLKLFYWPGTEGLKGALLEAGRETMPMRTLAQGITEPVQIRMENDRVTFSDRGGAGGVFCSYDALGNSGLYSDGRVVECTLCVQSGIGAGFSFLAGDKRCAVQFDILGARVLFGCLRDNWTTGLHMMCELQSKQALSYCIPHRIRLLVRGCFMETYIDDVYADGFRFSQPLCVEQIGIFANQASGSITDIRVWQMR